MPAAAIADVFDLDRIPAQRNGSRPRWRRASVGWAVDPKEWRKATTAAFGRPSRHLDYYEAQRWAAGVNEVLEDLGRLLDDGEAATVIPLVEYAFERADKAVERVDSSDGCFGIISDYIASLHLRACTEARPDPVALARRLAEFDLHAELDTFRRAAETYAEVLGPDGLAEYRRLVESAFDALGPRSANAWSGERLHVTEAMIALAWAALDADAVIRIKQTELRSPKDYEEIVAVLTAVERLPEAIDWARRGLAVDGREFQKPELRRQLIALLRESGDTAAAKAERIQGFHASPWLGGYKEVLDPPVVGRTGGESDPDRGSGPHDLGPPD